MKRVIYCTLATMGISIAIFLLGLILFLISKWSPLLLETLYFIFISVVIFMCVHSSPLFRKDEENK